MWVSLSRYTQMRLIIVLVVMIMIDWGPNLGYQFIKKSLPYNDGFPKTYHFPQDFLNTKMAAHHFGMEADVSGGAPMFSTITHDHPISFITLFEHTNNGL